jgi:hypothetical protein
MKYTDLIYEFVEVGDRRDEDTTFNIKRCESSALFILPLLLIPEPGESKLYILMK